MARDALTAKQRRALECLMTTSTIDDAAIRAGVHRSTLFRWLNEATFQGELRRAQGAALDAIIRRLVHLASDAGAALGEGLAKAEPTPTRLRAADIVLGRLMQLREAAEFDARISRLEGLLHDDQNAPGRP